MGTIVVGVDGSDTARRALRWALSEAALRRDEVHAVYAWTYPAIVAPIEAVTPPPQLDYGKEAREVLDAEVDAVLGEGGPEVKVTREVVNQPAPVALLRSSRGADMLVVGSRGYGGFRGLLLGSVGHQCVQHATCPVVIIPHEDRVAST